MADEERLLAHLAAAGQLVAERRFREAEVELLRALSGVPSDVRALNLLGLLRFKQGRLEEARGTYREIAASCPDDGVARLNLGLLALKLDRFDEAVAELEAACRLAPADPRAASYLGYAYAKSGNPVAAAAAFRRAGQETLAERLESRALPTQGPGFDDQRPSPMEVALSAPRPTDAAGPSRGRWPLRPSAATEAQPQPVVSFVLARLGLVEPVAPPQGEALHLTVRDEAHVRMDAALASVGARARWEPAFRRVRGRPGKTPLGADERRFFRLVGPGEVWVAGAPGQWVALSLDDDILYVREDRVLAFDDGITWEAGRLPGDGLHMLQFRGRGRVALQLETTPTALRLSADRPALVSRSRLLGWVGRVVAHRHLVGGGPFQLSCQGDGVMLLDGRGGCS